jgi:hypothetical protein
MGEVGAIGRPQRVRIEEPGQLVEIEIHHKEPVGEGVCDWGKAAVANPAFIDAAVHA